MITPGAGPLSPTAKIPKSKSKPVKKNPNVPFKPGSTQPKKPTDYVSGSLLPGRKYTAYKPGGGFSKPDGGAGAGPGIPFRPVEKTVPMRRKTQPTRKGGKNLPPWARKKDLPSWLKGKSPTSSRPGGFGGAKAERTAFDFRSDAIRRRLEK